MKTATPGDKVAYSRNFLKSMQAPACLFDLRGEVLWVKQNPSRARIKWSDGEEKTALLANLSKIGQNTEKARFDNAILE